MATGFSAFTNSRYYHPSFNSAIFDGPIRIYFVQFHESYALKIYFNLQEKFKDTLNQYKEIAKKKDLLLLIMIYPTEESFLKAFSLNNPQNQTVGYALENKDAIFGLMAPITDYNVGQLMDELSDIFIQWDKKALAEVVPSQSNYSKGTESPAC